MSDQPAHQERTDNAYVEHRYQVAELQRDVASIASECHVLRQSQQDMASILQFTAISLKPLNPHASAAIRKTIVGVECACKTVLDRTANLRRIINALHEPPPPPAEEPPADDEPEPAEEGTGTVGNDE